MNSPVFSQAFWIASRVVGSPRVMAPTPYLRKSFQISKSVRSARLAVTALGLYECEINGVPLGDQIFAPGWTEYRKRVQYQTHDVAPLLKPGENVIGAILGDGWYCGYVTWMPRQHYGERPCFLAQLEVIFEDGSSTVIASDGSWKTSTGPILENDLLMGESYDARLELGKWSQAGYDDRDWTAVLVMPSPEIAIVVSEAPPVKRMAELQPVLMPATPKTGHVRLFDFNQNFSGRVRLTVEAPRGTTLKLRFAEVLDVDGSIYTENLRSARATDYYTCKGGAPETWEPRFTFHGFRYAEVTGLPSDGKIDLTGIVLHSDTPPMGHFACSNPLLNQLQHNIVWGQKSNFLEVPTDCPQRDERAGWTGDAQVFIRTAAFNMDVQGFFHKWVQDIRDSQWPDGGVPPIIPNVGVGDITDGGPAWADATIICPWTIYLCYADRAILEDHYESMGRFMAFMEKHRCLGRVRSHPDVDSWGGFGDWLALDGSGKHEGATPRDLIGTALYAYDAEIMAKVATVLGRDDDAKRYRALHGEIAAAFRRRFVTPDGLMASATQTAYVLALHFGLVSDEQRPGAVRELVRDIEKRGFHLATGFVGTPYLLDVLEAADRLDVAYKLLEQETFPSWLFPVKNGATTIWERWDGWTPDKGFQNKGMNSFNHYAYGAVGAWMVKSVAGLELDPQNPGYRHMIFRPRPGGSITWAEASLKTLHGLASIRWELQDDKLALDLTVPQGTSATVSLPRGFTAKGPLELKAGTHHLDAVRTAQ